MAQTIVTLSGDDAELYKAFQRILDQQAKTDAGYKKIRSSSKEAADAAKAGTKRPLPTAIAVTPNTAAVVPTLTGKRKGRVPSAATAAAAAAAASAAASVTTPTAAPTSTTETETEEEASLGVCECGNRAACVENTAEELDFICSAN